MPDAIVLAQEAGGKIIKFVDSENVKFW